MSRFQKFTLRHISNGVVVQDGFDTYAIREGGTEVWAATSGENLSQLLVEIDNDEVKLAVKWVDFNKAEKPPEDDIIHTVGTPGLFMEEVYTPTSLRCLKDHIDFASDMTDEQKIDYLWDTIKIMHASQIAGVKS